MSNVIPFPARPDPEEPEEQYTIKYNPATRKVDIPLIPDNSDGGACILAVLIVQLIREGSMTEDQVLQTVLQAVGEL